MSGLMSAPVRVGPGGTPGVVVSELEYGDGVRFEVWTKFGLAYVPRDQFEIMTLCDAELAGCKTKHVPNAAKGTHVNCIGSEKVHLPRRINFFMVGMSGFPCGFCPLCNTYFFGSTEA